MLAWMAKQNELQKNEKFECINIISLSVCDIWNKLDRHSFGKEFKYLRTILTQCLVYGTTQILMYMMCIEY